MTRDLDQIAAILAPVLRDGARISGVSPLTTGFSNDTYLIEGLDLILRLPPAAGAMVDGHGVIAQARIYDALGRTPGAPPVPAVLHVEEGGDLLGAPFYVMARAPGEAVHDIFMQPWFTEASDAVRTKMSTQWVSLFADLANLAPLDALGAPVSPEDDLRMWRRFAAAANCAPLVEGMDRLLDHSAPLSGPAAVIHGDAKLSNLMWRDFAISAALDWEMSLNGEPLADLGYLLGLIPGEFHDGIRAPRLPGMIRRAEVIALWEAISGRSAQGVFWHEIAQIAKVTAIIAEGVNMHDTGRSSDPKLAYFKQNLTNYLSVMQFMLAAGGY